LGGHPSRFGGKLKKTHAKMHGQWDSGNGTTKRRKKMGERKVGKKCPNQGVLVNISSHKGPKTEGD